MLHYEFPEIRTIDDVLPAIKGREEFVVAEKDGYTVINYLVVMPDTFTMTGPDDRMGAIRRECRGLIFGADGRILSRPFHKFFNMGEREETQPQNVDVRHKHTIMEKMDGSMIRPLILGNKMHMATKMGVTDIALDAQKWLATQDDAEQKAEWILSLALNCKTPLFEWVSDANRVVIKYPEECMYLLAIRDNVTGRYERHSAPMFAHAPVHGTVRDMATYVAAVRNDKDREGDILRFADGHMVKIKCEWYVNIHHAMDYIKTERRLLEMVLEETLDDTISVLQDEDKDYVHEFEKEFWDDFNHKETRLKELKEVAETEYENDKKRIALEMAKTVSKKDLSLVFKMVDGHDLRTVMLDTVKKNLGQANKYDDMRTWLKEA